MMLAQVCKPFSCMLKIDDDVSTALSVDLTSFVGEISLNALEDIYKKIQNRNKLLL